MTQKERDEAKTEKVENILMSQIDDFPEHPYQVKMDNDMQNLIESIKETGLTTALIARKKDDGRFELISGHRRKKACELLGIDTLPVIVRNISRDKAILQMVDSNLQREKILPSEKAFAYKMKLEAMKRQGKRSDLTSSPG